MSTYRSAIRLPTTASSKSPKLVPDTEIEGLKETTGKEVLYSTYQNIGKTKNASLSGYINWNATSNTRIYANI